MASSQAVSCHGLGLPPRKTPPVRATGARRRAETPSQPSAVQTGQQEPSPPVSMGGSAREKRLNDVPRKYRQLYERAWEGKSRKSAIRVFCLACTGWSEHEVRMCTAPACPLFEFRELG